VFLEKIFFSKTLTYSIERYHQRIKENIEFNDVQANYQISEHEDISTSKANQYSQESSDFFEEKLK